MKQLRKINSYDLRMPTAPIALINPVCYKVKLKVTMSKLLGVAAIKVNSVVGSKVVSLSANTQKRHSSLNSSRN